ncbi:MAG TPA: phosphoribosylglycinamide formyltransferase [Firmicutes bacterium]|nr:phosphoribosylglycinamide formyltransferase [Bacillota bacterium]
MRGAEPRLGILVSGRGSNLEAILRAHAAGRLGAVPVLVVSDNPAAPALEKASRFGVPTAVVVRRDCSGAREFEEALVAALRGAGVELVALAGFMRLLGPAFLSAFPGRVLNIHPSLLPSFPGLHAQRQALAYGVRVSGCTVHLVDEEMDHGPILLQAAVPVLPDDTEETLAARILAEEHRLYPEAIRLVAEGRVRVEGRRALILEESAMGEE